MRPGLTEVRRLARPLPTEARHLPVTRRRRSRPLVRRDHVGSVDAVADACDGAGDPDPAGPVSDRRCSAGPPVVAGRGDARSGRSWLFVTRTREMPLTGSAGKGHLPAVMGWRCGESNPGP